MMHGNVIASFALAFVFAMSLAQADPPEFLPVPDLAPTPTFAPATQPSTPSTRKDDDDDDDEKRPTAPSGRYFFNLLDSRSAYGKDFFPDPFLGPEFDVEKQLELDYFHAERRHVQDNEVDAGFQWNVLGRLMVAGEFGWDSEREIGVHGVDDSGEESARGFENVDLAVYHPVFQYVSKSGFLDYTAVARLDVGIPTRTPVSGSDLQLTPYLGQLLRFGPHVSLEAWTGAQFTVAPHQSGHDLFIYGASLGYQLAHDQLPVPFTEQLLPTLEIDGQSPFSDRSTPESLFAVAGVAINFVPLGNLHPRLNLGYQFPLDRGARDELDWGIIANLFFEF